MEQLCYIHFELLNHKTQEGYWATDKGLQVKHLPEVMLKSKGKTATGFYNEQTQRFRFFNYSEQDWNVLFQEYIFHDKIADKFYYLYILRILYAINTSKFQPEAFKKAIHKQITDYPTIQEWFIKDLYKYISFASLNSQELILLILNEFGYDFKVVEPQLLTDAMDFIGDSLIYRGLGIFNQFRLIFNRIQQWKKEKSDYHLEHITSKAHNEIIQLMLWLNDLHRMVDISVIEKYFYYLGMNIRTLIIRKLFEEHRNKNYSINIGFLETLLNSKRKLLADYQTALFGFKTEVNPSLEILIDAIKNYTAKKTFLTLNSVIDIAIQQSGNQKVNINLDAKRLFDTCNGGLRINPKFNGFLLVEYQMTPNSTLALDNFRERTTTAISRIRNLKNLSYDDIDYVAYLIDELNNCIDDLPKLLLLLLKKYPANTWNMKGTDEISQCLMPELLTINKARFTLSPSIDAFSNKEEIKANIINILNEWTESNCKDEWVIPVQNKELINRIIKGFYIQNTGETHPPFYIDWRDIYKNLKSNLPRPTDICYGNLSDKRHHITNKSFVWCKHQPCFRTAIEYKQSWQDYKLTDMLNILGHNITEDKGCGFIADGEYNKFVDVMLKAQKVVDRLQCKECGHILFPVKRSTGNDSNEYTYYHCGNTQCKEYHHEIYINHCFNCKDGIINSRESKRCPNGLCICPDCLTCCSNDFFERMANKYLSSDRAIPQWINNRLGKGHKDQHILFCPKCGTEFDDTHTECPSCHYKWKFANYKRRI